jgi:peptide-methionine (S)-S-oxide reductase
LFLALAALAATPAFAQTSATATFAAGCFWCVEEAFDKVPGVVSTTSGYMGGQKKHPTYQEVSSGTTGHTEVVQVIYDPAKVSYERLLGVFFRIHDPTQLNRQGPDVGDNYRSAIFAATPEQERQARAFIDEQQKTNPRFKGRTIVTQVVPPGPAFYPAEDYHQDYHQKHGGSCPLPER